jgi:hypothetical protein
VPDEQYSGKDILLTLEIVEGYLTEAEDILWTTTSDVEPDEVRKEMKDLTEELWDVQHHLYELQRELEKEP